MGGSLDVWVVPFTAASGSAPAACWDAMVLTMSIAVVSFMVLRFFWCRRFNDYFMRWSCVMCWLIKCRGSVHISLYIIGSSDVEFLGRCPPNSPRIHTYISLRVPSIHLYMRPFHTSLHVSLIYLYLRNYFFMCCFLWSLILGSLNLLPWSWWTSPVGNRPTILHFCPPHRCGHCLFLTGLREKDIASKIGVFLLPLLKGYDRSTYGSVWTMCMAKIWGKIVNPAVCVRGNIMDSIAIWYCNVQYAYCRNFCAIWTLLLNPSYLEEMNLYCI